MTPSTGDHQWRRCEANALSSRHRTKRFKHLRASHALNLLLLGLIIFFHGDNLAIPLAVAIEDGDGDSGDLTQMETLLKLYDYTLGFRWKDNTNWLQNDDVCTWNGITCYDETESDRGRVGHISEIDLSDNRLNGKIPYQIYELPYINSIILRDNPDLEISFTNIEAADYLKVLILSNTNVPSLDGLDNAQQLEYLHLTDCQLEGNIPDEIYNLRSLRGFFANYNFFSGPISSRIKDLTELTELYLYDNGLSGQLPDEIGFLPKLKVLALAQNAFGGTMPQTINNLDNLEILAIQRKSGKEKGDGISGELPDLSDLSSITVVYLQNQKLTGDIPDNFLASAPKDEVVKVQLENNYLTGSLPTSLLMFERMKIYLEGNQITSLDQQFCNKQDWMSGNVGLYGCDAILCDVNFYNGINGRKSSDESVCEPCPGTDYLGSTECILVTTEPPTEREILQVFYDAMGGDQWVINRDWNDPSVDPCDWHGVYCEENAGIINRITLTDNNLQGAIPKELWQMPNLKILDLTSNTIDFKFQGISECQSLTGLYISDTGLSSLDGLSELTGIGLMGLDLSSNELTGAFPNDLFSISSLRDVSISHNAFSGALADNFDSFPNLRNFYAYGNDFTGQIPPSFGSCGSLRNLVLSENDFTGTLPPTLNNLVNLEMLSIHQKTKTKEGIKGPLISFKSCVSMTTLHLGFNALSGALPPDLLEESNVLGEEINVGLSYNKITGSIPQEWDRFDRLFIDLTSNEIDDLDPDFCNDVASWQDGAVGDYGCDAILCPPKKFNDYGRKTGSDAECNTCVSTEYALFYGSTDCVPSEEPSEQEILEKLYYATNGPGWTNNDGWESGEVICDRYGIECIDGAVVGIDLAENGLKGIVPKEIFTLSALKELDIQTNDVDFDFSEIDQAISLEVLYLSKTKLRSLNGIGMAKKLKALHITDNYITGRIPDELFDLTSLEHLFMNYNRFSGRLPSKIGQLTNLEELYLFQNELTGQIPASIGNLQNLKILTLTNNNFEGTLPIELNELRNIEILALQRQGEAGRDDVGGDAVGVDNGLSVKEGAGIRGPLLSFNKLENLNALYLGSNSLSGTIPYDFLDGIANKDSVISLNLIGNQLTGQVPASLVQFNKLNLFLADNKITGLANGLCLKNEWMGGLVALKGCNAILCPANYFSPIGREDGEDKDACVPCADFQDSKYLGSFSCADKIDQTADKERQILTELYESLDGPAWKVQTNWLDPDTSICEWYGITCVSVSLESVQSIHLSQNGLEGEVPSSIFQLSNLEELNFAQNDISISFGNIDPGTKLHYLNLDSTGLISLDGIEAASQLTLLHAMDNRLTFFPEGIFQLANLQVLYLSSNDLGPVLPSGLKALNHLVFLACDDCGFSGEIPEWIGEFSKLEYVKLNHNGFTGKLPGTLAELTNLKHLDLSEQHANGAPGLNGPLLDFASLGQLSELYLYGNQFEGNIPTTFLKDVSIDGTAKIDLRSNKLTGPIPDVLLGLPRLSLYLSDNMIDSIPAAMCDQSLTWNGGSIQKYAPSCDGLLCSPGTYNAFGFQVDSDSPCESCTSAGYAQYYGSTECGANEEKDILEKVYYALDGPNWDNNDGWLKEGDICNWNGVTCHGDESEHAGQVDVLDLEDNFLKGDVPNLIWNLPFVTEVNLKRNDITISFDGIENAEYLETLQLSETGLKDVNGISKATSIKSLHLTSNDMKSDIPDELYEMRNLQSLFLNYNRITGQLSPKIGQWTEMRNLFLFHNEITGPIPDAIGQLTNLEILALGENYLTGDIPEEINTLKELQIIALQREAGQTASEVGAPLTPKGEGETGGLTGQLPAFDGLPNLKELYLGSNQLTGTVPTTFLKGIITKTEKIMVDLTLNNLKGIVPAELKDFDDMELYIAGNQITDIADVLCSKQSWMNGEVAQEECDAILCPPNTYNTYGRADKDVPCLPCPFTFTTEYYGSLECYASQMKEFTEREVLRLFYQATNGDNWINNAGWMNDKTPICEWHGIHCGSDDYNNGEVVEEIHLPSNQLSGSIPPIIFQLPFMQLLDVGDNSVDIDFAGIGSATNLHGLYLHATQVKDITGIGEAHELRSLHLQENDFGSSEIPDELFELQNLRVLQIANSNFAGSLSSKIGNLVNLEEFYCHGNYLTGTIPGEIGALQDVEVINLSENFFIGELPQNFNTMKKLRTLFIDAYTRNTAGLSGPLLAFDQMPALRELYLGSNSLTGPIPKDLLSGASDKDGVIKIGLKSNQLTGTLPEELVRFSHLNIDIAGNMIKEIPQSLCEMGGWMEGSVAKFGCDAILCEPGKFNQYGRQSTEEHPCMECAGSDVSPFLGTLFCISEEKKQEKQILQLLYQACGGPNWRVQDNWNNDDVDICQWYGVKCDEGKTVSSLQLGSNNLVGTPPREIFDLPNLKWLWLYSNPINFSFDGIGKAGKLTSLLLDSTGLTSLEGIGDAFALVDLDVRFNKLSGPIPNEISRLMNLETFSCADNDLSGNFPNLSRLKKLKSVRAGNNQFSGPLPDFSSHPNLKSVDLSGNNFAGSIAPEFLASTDTSDSVYIDLSSNQIEGVVPGELSRFDKVTLYLRDNKITGIDQSLCSKELWNDGDVGVFQCDGILCPTGTWATNTGRASKNGVQCEPCEFSKSFGLSMCSKDADTEGSLRGNGTSNGSRRKSFTAFICILAIGMVVGVCIFKRANEPSRHYDGVSGEFT